MTHAIGATPSQKRSRRASIPPVVGGITSLLHHPVFLPLQEETVMGWYMALAETMQKIKLGNLNQVPSFIPDWRARTD